MVSIKRKRQKASRDYNFSSIDLGTPANENIGSHFADVRARDSMPRDNNVCLTYLKTSLENVVVNIYWELAVVK